MIFQNIKVSRFHGGWMRVRSVVKQREFQIVRLLQVVG